MRAPGWPNRGEDTVREREKKSERNEQGIETLQEVDNVYAFGKS